MTVLGLCCSTRFCLVAVSRSYSPVVAHRLLIAAASLVEEHRLCNAWSSVVETCGLSSCESLGSVVVVPGFSCSAACGLFPDQGSNPALAGGFFTAESQGKPLPYVFSYKSYSLSSLCLDFLRIFKMFLAVFYHPV